MGLNETSEGIYGLIEGFMTYRDGFMTLQNGYMGKRRVYDLSVRVCTTLLKGYTG